MSTEKQKTQADKAKRKPSSRATTTKRTAKATKRTAKATKSTEKTTKSTAKTTKSAEKKSTGKKNVSATSKFCTNCGNELSKGDKFCAACGTKVLQTQTRQQTQIDEVAAASVCGTPTAESAVHVSGNTPEPSLRPPEGNTPEPSPRPPEGNTPEPSPRPPEGNILYKASKAFVEMWFFIVMTVKADSAEEKREFRREAKKRMFRTPILALACPVTALALFVLSLVLANMTGKKFFIYTTIAFAMISFPLVFFFLCIAFTKLKEGDDIAPPAILAQPRDAKTSQTIPGLITWSIRIVVGIAILAIIGVVSIPSIGFISNKVNDIVSRSGGGSSSGGGASSTFSSSRTSSSSSTSKSSPIEPLVADTSNAVDINYQDHSSLSPGTICKISNYRVLTTMSDGVIAMFDYAQDYKTKSAARTFWGDGLVALAEMSENSSKPNIAIITNRKLCDNDTIPTIYARYVGPADLVFGRLRCFQEVRPQR